MPLFVCFIQVLLQRLVLETVMFIDEFILPIFLNAVYAI